MNKFAAIIIMSIMPSCDSNQLSLGSILSGLDKSYIRNVDHRGSSKEFLEEYGVTAEQFRRDSIEYHRAVESFFASPPSILRELLKFRNDTSVYCYWMGTSRPYNARIEDDDLVSRSVSALGLIDCYLTSNAKRGLQMNSYVLKLSFDDLSRFLSKSGESPDLEKIKRDYLLYIEQFHRN